MNWKRHGGRNKSPGHPHGNLSRDTSFSYETLRVSGALRLPGGRVVERVLPATKAKAYWGGRLIR